MLTVIVVGALMAMFRWTALGLKMRAVVESRRMSQLEGVNSEAVSGAAWAMSSLLAGLAGVLLLPLSPVLSATNPLQFTSLLVAGLTAAAVASMTSIPVALIASIGLGVIENLISGYLPGGVLATAATSVFPFAILVGALLLNPGLRHLDKSSDPMSSVDPPPAPPAMTVRDRRLDAPTKWGFRILVVAFIVSSLTWVPGVWVTGLATGETLSIVFLVDHADHRHERPAVAVPVDLRRHRRVHRGTARHPYGDVGTARIVGGCVDWRRPPASCSPWWRCGCRASCSR